MFGRPNKIVQQRGLARAGAADHEQMPIQIGIVNEHAVPLLFRFVKHAEPVARYRGLPRASHPQVGFPHDRREHIKPRSSWGASRRPRKLLHGDTGNVQVPCRGDLAEHRLARFGCDEAPAGPIRC